MKIRFIGGDAEHGEVFAVRTKTETGMLFQSDKHAHPHPSALVSVKARVSIDGVSREIVR
ncbi:hypothetical protein [Paucibacter sp. B51]|uniref:hypothetical protein n=1 Tax=Paucibacter sp. B51 TaxID=2993315 RepID=UPI0022EBBD47|nr:hypothetical protein [Paucibacter sp. B51]